MKELQNHRCFKCHGLLFKSRGYRLRDEEWALVEIQCKKCKHLNKFYLANALTLTMIAAKS